MIDNRDEYPPEYDDLDPQEVIDELIKAGDKLREELYIQSHKDDAVFPFHVIDLSNDWDEAKKGAEHDRHRT
jgi:hypothetical protein